MAAAAISLNRGTPVQGGGRNGFKFNVTRGRQTKSMTAASSPEALRGRRQTAEVKRAMLAEFCRVWGGQLREQDGDADPANNPPIPGKPDQARLGPRLRQTLDLLLAGDSEKQIAAKLGLSPHTIHDYVKTVYRRFGVNTRAELLALWVRK